MLAAARGAMPLRAPAAVRPASRGLAMVSPVMRPTQSTSFAGSSLAPSSVRAPGRGSLVVMAAKTSMACTISGKGSNRKRRTTSGFRTRLQSKSGVNVLKARRKKGRAVLAPASQKKSGGKK